MSRPKHRDPRRNVVKPQMERLEIRWLLSQSQGLIGTRRRIDAMAAELEQIGGGLGRTLSAEFVRWQSQHPATSGSGTVALATFEARKLANGGLGSWGGLRLLVQMENQGDHQFDALYQRLSGRYEQWAAIHPDRAHVLGINPIPIASPGTNLGQGTTTPGTADNTAENGTGAMLPSPTQPTQAGPSPDSHIPPPNQVRG